MYLNTYTYLHCYCLTLNIITDLLHTSQTVSFAMISYSKYHFTQGLKFLFGYQKI